MSDGLFLKHGIKGRWIVAELICGQLFPLQLPPSCTKPTLEIVLQD